MVTPPSCTAGYSTTIPPPPTTLGACAVPLGGSNSTLLDTCCNGHINPISTYAAPGATDKCYQFCTTEFVTEVYECLAREEHLGPARKLGGWDCVHAEGHSRKSEAGMEYEAGVGRVRMGRGLATVIGALWVFGTMVVMC